MEKNSRKTENSFQEFSFLLRVDRFNYDELLDYCRTKGLLVHEIKTWVNVSEQPNEIRIKQLEEELRGTKQKLKALANEMKQKNYALADIATAIISRGKKSKKP
ncbi:hypothetical protein ACFQ5D_00670 [Paenibacillus farraposensis]|uniref:Uncharacterized protein n=1 Tax=Paenibacillus farraposensis TaxID=2807095 RepID=A0ABW4D5N3_9BACL|nr:hypothetical protein [Paenibacillus farraposensis]MCC3378339.1 hypothetical protein [Paenibacillus farraposensis]